MATRKQLEMTCRCMCHDGQAVDPYVDTLEDTCGACCIDDVDDEEAKL